MNDELSGCGPVLSTLLYMIVLLFLAPAIIMMLWNSILIDIFDLPTITYWEAFAIRWVINLLCSGINKPSISWGEGE